ncbi:MULTISPECIES: DUF5723 family protein [unclassified Capnocytophaga]|jgi:outer membrane protein, ompA family|uniref:DUF5723 family protein n=1 Tax=unclassified Capnocytophaga TaxID=2640652 RepID=UPI000202E93C|nr:MULTISPECIES: DUF5723 family protein [unclassified Capnocytophaga]EGD33083.1 OmpA family outer membrane protein [Capnocytophaga sp. oral taxon 338 str. F0234]MEB3005544.1 DUF5723 family protein [Capnocytophaga sp. G2]
MKRICLSLLVLATYQGFAQQSFSGLRTSVYGGTLTPISNPANVLGARPWDANLISVDADMGNNTMGFSPNLTKSLEDFSKGLNNVIDANIKADILGPSFLYRINKKHAVGLFSRARAMASVDGVDAKMLQAFLSAKNLELPTNPSDYYKVKSINDMNLLVNAFMEIGATYAYTLYNDGYNLMRVGATLKYVQGSGSFRMGFSGINSDNVTLRRENGDVIMHVGNGYAEVRSGGLNVINDGSLGDLFKSEASTVGLDLGFVYEYSQDGCPNCDGHIPYDFKVGVSLLDLGRLKYKTNKNSFTYTLHNQDINLENMQDSFDKMSDALKRTQEGESFASSLPTTLNINLDYRFIEGVYLNLSSQFNVVKKNEYNARYANDFVLTPRWENNTFGAYLPMSINSVSKFNVGTAVRLGPLFFGSRSILTNLIAKNNAKELNFFFGIRFGGAFE